MKTASHWAIYTGKRLHAHCSMNCKIPTICPWSIYLGLKTVASNVLILPTVILALVNGCTCVDNQLLQSKNLVMPGYVVTVVLLFMWGGGGGGGGDSCLSSQINVAAFSWDFTVYTDTTILCYI